MQISKAFAQTILFYLTRSVPKGQRESDELLDVIRNLERLIQGNPKQ